MVRKRYVFCKKLHCFQTYPMTVSSSIYYKILLRLVLTTMQQAMSNTKDIPNHLQEEIPKFSGKRRIRHLEPLTVRDILHKDPPTKRTLQKMGKQPFTKQREEPKGMEKPKLKRKKRSHSLKPLFNTSAKAVAETIMEPKSPTMRDFKTWFPDVSETEWLRLKALQAHHGVESVLGSSAARSDERSNDLRALDELDTEQHGVDTGSAMDATEQLQEKKIDDGRSIVHCADDNYAGASSSSLHVLWQEKHGQGTSF